MVGYVVAGEAPRDRAAELQRHGFTSVVICCRGVASSADPRPPRICSVTPREREGQCDRRWAVDAVKAQTT